MQSVIVRLLSVPGVCCPVCHAVLRAEAPETIRCTGCGRAYPARDGLPVLIRGEATEKLR